MAEIARRVSAWVGLTVAACSPADSTDATGGASTSGTDSTQGPSDAGPGESGATSGPAPTSADGTSGASDPTATSGDTTTNGQTSGDTTDDTTGRGDCLGFDANGVAQLYCTDPEGAPQWVLGFDDWQDRIDDFGEFSGDGAETIVEQGDQVRMTVAAVDFECEGLEDHGLALEQGYMCSPLDWSDFEITGYFQLVEASAEATNHDVTWYGASGRHTGDGPPIGCLGASYKGSVDYVTGQVRVGKESWHVNYDWHDWTDVEGGVDLTQERERWIGMKVVRYRFTSNGADGIRNEIWLDLAGVDADGAPMNDWQLATVSDDHPDQPSWGTEATACNAPVDDQIMFWGGPRVTWRWDDTIGRLRLMSVREIIPPV